MGYVEVIYNIEYIPLANSTGPYQQQPALVAPNTQLVELRDNVAAKVPSFSLTRSSVFTDRVEQSIRAALRMVPLAREAYSVITPWLPPNMALENSRYANAREVD